MTEIIEIIVRRRRGYDYFDTRTIAIEFGELNPTAVYNEAEGAQDDAVDTLRQYIKNMGG